MIRFPNVQGRNLLGEHLRLPQDFAGEHNLVLICFTMEQQLEVNTWLTAAQDWQKRYARLEVYELPTLPRYNRLYQAYIDYVMVQGIPNPSTRKATITLYLDLERFQAALGLAHRESAFALIVDRDGRVLACEAGGHTPEKAARLETVLAARLAVT